MGDQLGVDHWKLVEVRDEFEVDMIEIENADDRFIPQKIRPDRR